jgi:predicted amidohydrolase
MQLPRTWIVFSAALSAGALSLLPIGIANAQEAVTVDVTQESATVEPQTGEVTVSGIVTCSGATEAQVYANVTQPVGREGAVNGGNYALVPCDQDGEPYTISFFGYDGRFGPGRAVVTVDAFACGFEICDDARVQQSVRLTRP